MSTLARVVIVVYAAVMMTAACYGLIRLGKWISADPLNRALIMIELIIAFICLVQFVITFLRRKDS
jgi:hypothetical protein